MSSQQDGSLVVTITTPGSVLSKRVSMGGHETLRPSVSPNYSEYSDSFDQDSPINIITPKKRAKYNGKIKGHKSATLYHKPKITASRGILRGYKPNETTQKLMEANQIKINELMSENADCHRQLVEKTNECKTLENQNKLQERYLKKINNRDADIPTIISKYNSQIHSLQELLRRNKEKLDVSEKQKRNIEIDLQKERKKNEKLNVICESNHLHEKGDLSKKIVTLNDFLEAERKKVKEMERSMELLTKKHTHELSVENRKHKVLNQMYKDVVVDLKEVRNLLKEKTKLLEMQNIYSKMMIKPPHHLVNTTSDMGDCDDLSQQGRTFKSTTSNKNITLDYKESKERNSTSTKKVSKVSKPTSILKKTSRDSMRTKKSLLECEEKEEEQIRTGIIKEKVFFYGNTPSEVSEVEEKSDKNDRFSDLHRTVLRQMQPYQKEEDLERMLKNDLLAKLKHIDESPHLYSNPDDSKEEGGVKEKEEERKYQRKEKDVFCSSESDAENSDQRSTESNFHQFVPQGSASLIRSRRNLDSQRGSNLSNFDFLAFPLNNNNCYEAETDCKDSGEFGSFSDCEQINID